MAFHFIPQEVKFFDLFDQQSENNVKAAECFKKYIHKGTFDDAAILEMRDIEHEGDSVTHEIIDKLNRTFITPFDREDIHSLAHELDNVVDMLYTTSKRIRLYKLKTSSPELFQFADLIIQSVNALERAVKGMRNHKNCTPINESCIEINHIENQGDLLRDAAIEKLFAKTKNPVMIIKWKEIYEGCETTLDICEDVANRVESILVKQG